MSAFDEFVRAMSRILHAPVTEKLEDRDLADLGLSRSDLAMLRSGEPGAHERITAMARQFGLQQSDLNTHLEISLALAENCGHCQEAKTCHKALQRGEALPEDKCPNAGIYRSLSGV